MAPSMRRLHQDMQVSPSLILRVSIDCMWHEGEVFGLLRSMHIEVFPDGIKPPPMPEDHIPIKVGGQGVKPLIILP